MFSKKPAKKIRYKVTVKGVKISGHYTKKNATIKATSIRGARVVKIGTSTYKKRSSTRRKKTYRSRRY